MNHKNFVLQMSGKKALFSIFLVLLLVQIFIVGIFSGPLGFFYDSAIQMQQTLMRYKMPDSTYESAMNEHNHLIVEQIRQGPDEYDFIMMDHTSEPLIYDLVLPRVLSPKGQKYFTYGPQPWVHGLSEQSKSATYGQRWQRILFTSFVWFGAGWFFFRQSIAMALLAGALLLGWGTQITSALFGLPGKVLYDYLLYAVLLSALMGVAYRIRLHKINSVSRAYGPSSYILVALAVLALWPTVQAYFIQPLQGWDARVMWGYHFKFFFHHGFNPDFILKHMSRIAERDYPWFLGGAVGVASFRDSVHFGGWYENAVYGALSIPLLSVVSLIWNRLGKWATFGFTILFFYPFRHLLSNGYMEALWIPTFVMAVYGSLFFNELTPLGRENTIQQLPPFSRLECGALMMFAVSSKNEAMACALALIAWRLVRYEMFQAPIRKVINTAVTLLVPCVPALMHKLYVTYCGIYDQYGLWHRIRTYPPYDALKRFESLWRYLIGELFWPHLEYVLPIIILVALFIVKAIVNGTYEKKFISHAALALFVMMTPILLVYVYTPHDQIWQLETSANRVFMVVPALVTSLIFLPNYKAHEDI